MSIHGSNTWNDSVCRNLLGSPNHICQQVFGKSCWLWLKVLLKFSKGEAKNVQVPSRCILYCLLPHTFLGRKCGRSYQCSFHSSAEPKGEGRAGKNLAKLAALGMDLHYFGGRCKPRVQIVLRNFYLEVMILAQWTRFSITITLKLPNCIKAGTDLDQVFTAHLTHLKMMLLGATVVRINTGLKTGWTKSCNCGVINWDGLNYSHRFIDLCSMR